MTARAASANYNAAEALIAPNIGAGRGDKAAFIDDARQLTYGQLHERVRRFAAGLTALGIAREERVLLCLLDTIDFPVAFLGAIYAGIIAVPVNTLLTTQDYDFMLRDSRARALVVSSALLPTLAPTLDASPDLRAIIVSGEPASQPSSHQMPSRSFDRVLETAPQPAPAMTHTDEPCFWLYSSGSTGTPKGTVHVHTSLVETAELYAKPVLGIVESDVVFSAAKLFFAYGLGNGLTFPMSVGATAVLMAERPTPASVARVLRTHRPTIFYGVPTLYNAMLASPELPTRAEMRLRRCPSAGEALPAETGRRWRAHFGVDILDGIGSTEMLHIFLSNRPGEVRYGTTGVPVPGYALRLVDDEGQPVPDDTIGELQVCGPTAAAYYWNDRERSRATFHGPWTKSGDKYMRGADGFYTYCGRTDDMLKVGGIYVAPFEVEAMLGTHEKILEAAVVGQADEAGLIKPKAYVVLRAGVTGDAALVAELQAFVKARLAAYKYPRWIEFLPELPKTATGKIQRFKLRL